MGRLTPWLFVAGGIALVWWARSRSAAEADDNSDTDSEWDGQGHPWNRGF